MASKFTLISLIAHILIGILIWESPNRNQYQEPIAIEVNSGAQPSFTKNKSIRIPRLSLDKLGFGTSQFHVSKDKNIDSMDLSQKSWSLADSYQVDSLRPFEGMNIEQARFFRSLWHEIDNSIEEPAYLSEYGHTGKAYFQFEITRNGELKESSLNAVAVDNVLKVLAARAIRKALKNTNGEILFLDKDLQFNAQFTWSDYKTCQTLRGIKNNYLSFCRYAEDKRKTFTAGEKATTYVESLKYGFGAWEEIQKYRKEEKHRDTEFDPFASLKQDPDWNLGTFN